MSKDYQERDKFFYCVPRLFPNWEYPSRLAISISLDDNSAKGEWRNKPVWRWKIKDGIYEVDRNKGIELGNKFHFAGSTCGMPNLLPKEELREIKLVPDKVIEQPIYQPTKPKAQLNFF